MFLRYSLFICSHSVSVVVCMYMYACMYVCIYVRMYAY